MDFLILSDNLCLLVDVFMPFTFKVTTDIVRLISTML